jgi:predicted nucleotidyltransferase
MLFGLLEKDITAINSIFKEYKNIEQVIIYGSRAKGNYKNGSDIDLTIIDNDLTLTQLLEIENKLDDLLLPYKIDLSQKRSIANPDLVEHINRIGKQFYKK